MYAINTTLFTIIALVLSQSAYTADRRYCADYVLVAISQYWQSIDANCNFSGSRWNSDYEGQFKWCLSAHQWVAENEQNTRKRLLEECIAKSSKSKAASLDAVVVPQQQGRVFASDSELASSINIQLLEALAKDDVEAAKALVEQGANINFVTTDMQLIKQFNMAYQYGDGINISGYTDGVKISGNSTNAKQQGSIAQSESLLSYAINKGLVNTGLWLLQKEQKSLSPAAFNQSKRDLLGRALVDAVKGNDTNLVTRLLAKGADINYEVDHNFGTPLYFAVLDQMNDMASLLLERGASPSYTTNGGPNMLNYVLNSPTMLKLLLQSGADPNSIGESSGLENLPLNQAVDQSKPKAVGLLLEYGAKPDIADHSLRYPLIRAISNKRIDIVGILLKYGANPNLIYNNTLLGTCSETEENLAPLSEAIKVGADEIIAILKANGAKTSTELCGRNLQSR